MHKTDFADFRLVLEALSRVFAPLKPLPDDLVVQTYWGALRDQPIETVKRCAEKHQRYGKFFPKPFELRPKDDKPPSTETPTQRAQLDAAVRFNRETWDIAFRDNPERARLELAIAKAARIEICSHPSTPQYAQARAEAKQADDALHALRLARAQP